jgi:hypothetical protein
MVVTRRLDALARYMQSVPAKMVLLNNGVA